MNDWMTDGLIVVNKDEGFTSHDVIAKLRGILRMRKMGHTGTLDPIATGVLPVLLGQATRMEELLIDKVKGYRVVMHLGAATDTLDRTGTILETREICAGEEEILKTAAAFLGEQMQLPPMYSAVQVGGKRLYDIARSGKTVERTPRKVYFYKIGVEKIELPYVTLDVECSKGTYIRTLCDDFGKKLGCLAYMEELVRTRSGDFTLGNSRTLQEIEEYRDAGRLNELIIPLDSIMGGAPRVSVTPGAGDHLLSNGNPLAEEYLACEEGDREFLHGQELLRMYRSDGRFLGLYHWQKKKSLYYPVKAFPIPEE